MTAEPMQPSEEGHAPVRVVEVEVPDHLLSEALFGPGILVRRCRVVFRHMLPAPESAVLEAVTGHALVLGAGVVDPALPPTRLLVPWAQVSYITFIQG